MKAGIFKKGKQSLLSGFSHWVPSPKGCSCAGCVSASLGCCGECRSVWAWSEIEGTASCKSFVCLSLNNFYMQFPILVYKNSFHVCCTTNSSIYPWLIWQHSTKKQPRLKMLSYVELLEICQCLKLSLHKRSFFLYSLAATVLHYHS